MMSSIDTINTSVQTNHQNLADFISLLKATNAKVKSHYAKYEDAGRTIISDGVADPETYLNAPIKILWLMKEPYCDGNNGGGGWSMCHNLKQRALGTVTGSGNTWNPIMYTSYGILNNFISFEEMPTEVTNPKLREALLSIAFVNVQKLPAKKRTDSLSLKREFDERNHFTVIKDQLIAYRPDIVIGGKTLHLIKDKLDIQPGDDLEFGHFKKNKTLFINTYHPGQSEITTADYVNKIIQRAKQWQDVYK